MRTKLLITAFLIVTLCFITSCSNKQSNIQIYSFSGENNVFAINDGLIIVTNEMEKFIGGDITFKDKEPLEIKNSSEKFYFYKDGKESIILNNFESIQGSEKGTSIASELGSSSSKDFFYGDELELIKKIIKFLPNWNFNDRR